MNQHNSTKRMTNPTNQIPTRQPNQQTPTKVQKRQTVRRSTYFRKFHGTSTYALVGYTILKSSADNGSCSFYQVLCLQLFCNTAQSKKWKEWSNWKTICKSFIVQSSRFIDQLWIQFLELSECVFPYLPNLHRMPVHWSAPWKHKSRYRSSLSDKYLGRSGCRQSENPGFFVLVILSVYGSRSLVFVDTFFYGITVRKSSFPLPRTVELHLTTIVEQELVGNSLPQDVPTPSQRIKSPPRRLSLSNWLSLECSSNIFNSWSPKIRLFTDININISR